VQGQLGKDSIDAAYIGKRLSGEGGFWYDATANLEKVRGLLQQQEPDREHQGRNMYEKEGKITRSKSNRGAEIRKISRLHEEHPQGT
jgi:hypothetical protein